MSAKVSLEEFYCPLPVRTLANHAVLLTADETSHQGSRGEG
ncbi:Uncharacterised protein [Mycobacteroides abscessus subsp. abscessus]|nr:Uncharacterised protein [Mycobacteroides abscessus subsp. abscessus]